MLIIVLCQILDLVVEVLLVTTTLSQIIYTEMTQLNIIQS